MTYGGAGAVAGGHEGGWGRESSGDEEFGGQGMGCPGHVLQGPEGRGTEDLGDGRHVDLKCLVIYHPYVLFFFFFSSVFVLLQIVQTPITLLLI